VRPTLPIHSFLSSKGIREELERIGAGRRFEDLDIPLVVTATDIFRRCEVTFTEGVVWPRLLASMAIPGIYPALRSAQSFLVDGAVLNPVPARQVRDLGAGIVVGVRLTGSRTSPREDLDIKPGKPLATETIIRCLEIMQNRLSELSRNDSDVTIEVCLERGGLRDFDRAVEIAQGGYDATMAARAELAAVMPYVAEVA
jgi:NTE family protein